MSSHEVPRSTRVRFSLRLLLAAFTVMCVFAAVVGARFRYFALQQDTVRTLCAGHPFHDAATAKEINDDSVTWWNASEVRVFGFVSDSPSPADIALLRNFHGLEHLGFSGFVLTRDQVNCIPVMPQVKSLLLHGEELPVWYRADDSPLLSVFDIEPLAGKFPSLQQLTISSLHLSDASVRRISTFHLLKELQLTNALFTPDMLLEISRIPSLTSLVIIVDYEYSERPLFGDGDLTYLSRLPRLKHLTLYNRHLTKNCIDLLREITSLEELNLLYGSEYPTMDEREEIRRQLPGVQIAILPDDSPLRDLRVYFGSGSGIE